MLDVRYVAGLFDGEGCICLCKFHAAATNYPTHSLHCVISMTHKPIIKMLHAQFGGIYTQRTVTNDKWRNAFSLQWVSRKAVPFLEMLRPHLILKAEEADIALAFLHSRLRSPGTSWWRRATKEEIAALLAEREAVRLKLSALKRINHSVTWDSDEFGEQPMPGESAEGQPRAKPVLVKTGSV